MAQDYWWVTRPKRKLNAIPEELAAFCSAALGRQWTGNREAHLSFEKELESTGTKRIGERRDAKGSGGRTHAVMLYSLGLWFEKADEVFLTLAGEAIMKGKPPVPILKKQVLNFQYPSAYSASVKISPRFTLKPFIFLLKLLADNRITLLSQEEIAFVVAIQAENDGCFEKIAKNILIYREANIKWQIFGDEYLSEHGATEGNLMDLANTMMNWLDYTQLVYREKKVIVIDPEKLQEVRQIIENNKKLIHFPDAADIYQRKYGLDPWHLKDTRNLLHTTSISSRSIDRNRIIRTFFNYSSLNPISTIDSKVVEYIQNETGTDYKFTESVLMETYPHGAISGYLINYRNMAFKGREKAIDFEIATMNLFHEIFKYQTIHLGQTGAKSAPDVLIVSDTEGYQAIIENKAYSQYSISGDHHNRMVYNYLKGISNYSEYSLPIGFFTYISGGFASNIDSQIQNAVDKSGIHGSGITVSNLIAMIEKHTEEPYSHRDLRKIFGLDRQILLSDIN